MLSKPMVSKIVSLMTALLAAAPAAAEGRRAAMWGEAGLWEIYADPLGRNGCFAARLFLSGAVMRIRVRADGGLELLIARGSWQFANAGKTYRLKFVFGNGRAYEEELEAVAMGSTIALVKPRMSAAFMADFMEKTSLLVYHRGSLVAPLVLLDTDDAITQLRTCNASAPGARDLSDPSMR